ncbi:MAG: polyhydroxyalkanoate synthesis repressor PhaR [Thiocapsa sp.]|jgi:polyhydroxyalkanoate synthesis repressor PhaR|nr:polyhydroxyalkanoate synthesis repressor PhaR [Thiocapsa sp.]MCG6895601.1 polyhydroxyalkanoate synthesis repressor PhaR [Thiocapsa sp.]MCG6985920.1 polyhydroxyalkanoate synthesis repressor PhaR [Thiocapsa sp.]
MKDQRIIKKYPNRRLYDTEVSRYITLADVRDLVMSCASFKVIDTANDQDITRSILLQIMLDEESGGEPLFTATMLSQIIRFYGGTLQGMFARYLESSLDLFSKQHQELARSWGETPFDAMSRMTRKNVQLWTEIQGEFMRAAGFAVGGDRPKKAEAKQPGPRDNDATGHDESM